MYNAPTYLMLYQALAPERNRAKHRTSRFDESVGQLNSEELNTRLAKYKNECGCTTASLFMLATFVVTFFAMIRQDEILSLGFLKHLPLLVLLPNLAAGLGKAMSILHARYQYKQLSRWLPAHPSS